MSSRKVAVIGGGLAGSEVVWQLVGSGLEVTLYEMKPQKFSPAHKNADFGELVCSNSLRSEDPQSAVGLLKEEMGRLNSLVMQCAYASRVPAGKALAVDREDFSRLITVTLEQFPNLHIQRKEIETLDEYDLSLFQKIVVAAGPLMSAPLSSSLQKRIAQQNLYFYDAIAPIVYADSIDMQKVFWGSRYAQDQDDYLNCPLSEDEYHALRQNLLQAQKIEGRHFESLEHFEGCLPIETMAERGEMTLAFGPLKPVGLVDPRSGKRPFAVVQLRRENREATMFNMVGFQTKLTYGEQQRIFRLIPGLENARFARLGSMHRNTYVNAPQVLRPDLELLKAPNVYLAGQITGVEGYVESAACGVWLGFYLKNFLQGKKMDLPPGETAMGGLLRHLQVPEKNFQPMNVNFGLLTPLQTKVKKAERKQMYLQRARKTWDNWIEAQGKA